jgi:hypothetical protein
MWIEGVYICNICRRVVCVKEEEKESSTEIYPYHWRGERKRDPPPISPIPPPKKPTNPREN